MAPGEISFTADPQLGKAARLTPVSDFVVELCEGRDHSRHLGRDVRQCG